MKKQKIRQLFLFFVVIIICSMLSSCYSVFSGGTGGLVVDKESTSTPKSGIANVDVYAYLNGDERDYDFDSWTENQIFSPNAQYYGHTTTNSDGHFSISKLTWKEYSPDFGRDGDFTKVYLLFYHENYGLTKGETIIISDSTSDTVYTELTSVRKTTALSLNFVDVTTNNTTSENIYVKVSVPQTTQTMVNADPKVYETTVTGNGSLSISYPRWKSAEDRTNGIENTPEITISYIQSADETTWAGCYNKDNEEKNYAFRDDAKTGIAKRIKNSSYSITFYGKPIKISMPAISGQYVGNNSQENSSEGETGGGAAGTAGGATGNSSSAGNSSTGSSTDDGKLIKLFQQASDGEFSIDCGQVYTQSQALGSNGTEKHGVFSDLGKGFSWMDAEYTEKYAETTVKVRALDSTDSGMTVLAEKELQIRSDSSTVTVQLSGTE